MRTSASARSRQQVVSRAEAQLFIGSVADERPLVNLGGNYDYLSQAYYVSQDYGNEGRSIVPTCDEMLDAYVPPLFLEKAKLAKLPIPEYYITNGYFEPPVIVDPINPFTLKGRIVLKSGRAKSIAKSLTRNFTYAVCCQELPEGSHVAYFRSVLGWSAQAKYRDLAGVVWEVFHIPLARVRIIRMTNNECLFSDLSPLPFEYLSARELSYIDERVTWDS